MAITGPDSNLAARYLTEALRRHTQVDIARPLALPPRLVRHRVANQAVSPQSCLFTNVSAICVVFKGIGGRYLISSEWGSYAQKNHTEHCPDVHAINGDTTQR